MHALARVAGQHSTLTHRNVPNRKKRKGDEVSTDPAIHPLVKWEAPKQEYAKVNFDAAFQEESR
jgi:hypothetical protein